MKKQKSKIRCIGIIPARFDSQRLPGKPLVSIAGKPMIEQVYRRVKKAKSLDEVIVATDDKRIFKTVKNFGGKVMWFVARIIPKIFGRNMFILAKKKIS